MATGYHAVPRTDATGSDRSARQGARKGGYPEVADRRAIAWADERARPKVRVKAAMAPERSAVLYPRAHHQPRARPGQEREPAKAPIIEELTDLVEEAVLTEFDRIIRRTADGVLGAMETM